MIKKQKQIPDFFIYTILTSILIILCMPFLLTRNGLECLDFRETGQIGDTIGGITAPFIGLINVILLCYTLYCQKHPACPIKGQIPCSLHSDLIP